MKKVILSLTLAVFTITGILAQENKDVQSTTTVKKVTQKGTDVKTKVIAETETDKEILKVEGNEKQDQAADVIKKKDIDSKVVADDVSIDVANQQQMMAIKQRQEAELAQKIAAQKAEAAAQAERERQAKSFERQKELEARRAALTNRPEGMAKLKKD
jgi:hypothetical protein